MARLVVEYTHGDYECSCDVTRCVVAPSREAFLEAFAVKMHEIIEKHNSGLEEREARLEKMRVVQSKMIEEHLRTTRRKPSNKPLTAKQQKRQEEFSAEQNEFLQLQAAMRADQPIPSEIEVFGFKCEPHQFFQYSQDHRTIINYFAPEVTELDDWFGNKVGE